MTEQAEKSKRFLASHRGESPLLIPNAWDVGSARYWRRWGSMRSRAPAAGLRRRSADSTTASSERRRWPTRHNLAATELPVSADLENGSPTTPGVAETVQVALEAGLAGCSVEDYSGGPGEPDLRLRPRRGADRRRGRGCPRRASAARPHRTRREPHPGRPDLGDTIARLQAYQDAGADVLFAPGLS